VLAREDASDHLLLDATEVIEAEDALEKVVRVAHGTQLMCGPSAPQRNDTE
jgi:hypothetical protein